MNDSQQLEQLEQLLAFDLAERIRSTDELWALVNDGTLTPHEAVAEAQRLDPDLDAEELLQQAQLFAPPSAEAQTAQLDVLLTTRFAPAVTRRNLGWLVTSGAVGLAAAAALVVSLWPAHPPLPDYDIDWKSFSGLELGDDDGSQPDPECETRFHHEHVFEVDLRPATTVEHEIGVVARAVSLDGTSLDLTLVPEIKAGGFIRIRQQVSDLHLTPGEWLVTFVVGPHDALPEGQAINDVKPEEHPEFVVLSGTFCIIE